MPLNNLKKYKSGNPKGRAGRTAKNARHSSEDPNWITDEDTLQAERLVYENLGLEIDLDPFSSEIANEFVRAKRFFTEADDGFAQPWVCEAMHINHPGGTTKQSWRKLIDEVRLGNTQRAQWVGFSVEQLCILADPLEGPRALPVRYPSPQDFTCVMLRSRIDFIKEATRLPGGRPGHSNYVCLVGIPRATAEFYWGTLGRVFHGSLSGLTGDDLRKALASWPG
jgi:hypothetical protein